jgi:hypothetical protein
MMNQTIGKALIVAATTVLLWPVAAASEETEPLWHVRGLMSDACQCAVFCPCEFNEKPTFGHCDDTAIMHIEEGRFDHIDLDGQRLVVTFQSPEGERLFDTIGDLNFARIFVPDDTTDAQFEALEAVAGRVFGALVTGMHRLAEDQTVHRVPMQIDLEPLRHRVTIPGILELDVEAITGGDGENPMVLQNIGGPEFGDVIVAKSHRYRYTYGGVDWNYSGRSASFRTFDLSGNE